MENANSREYLEKIKAAVFENLRHTVPVPSVQMQDVPPSFGAMTDEEEAELDDLNEDLNKDVRVTEHAADKRTSNEAEFEDSGDEEMPEANGAPRGDTPRKRPFTDFGREGAPQSSTGTPANESPADAEIEGEVPEAEDPDVTIEDADAAVAATTEDKPEAEPEPESKKDDEPAAPEAEPERASKSKSKEPEPEPAPEVKAQEETPKENKEPEKETHEKEETRVDADGDVGMGGDEGETVVKEEDKR